MASRNKKKSAALNKENCEKHPRSNLAQKSNVPRSKENYITQVSEEIESRVTERLSQEFNRSRTENKSRTENSILGALARLDDFLMNPLLQGHSGTTPEASRNALGTSQGNKEDDSQNDPHLEAGFFHSQTMQNSGPEDDHDTKLLANVAFYEQSLQMMQLHSQLQRRKREVCRSTTARLVDSHSLSRRTYHARRHQTKNSRLKTSYTYTAVFPVICI